jgi:DNA repair photolyase
MLKGIKECSVSNMPEDLEKEIIKLLHLTMLRVNISRMTEPYMPITKNQDRAFPIKS